MNAQQETLARNCLAASYDNTMDFPAIIGALMSGGFEGYTVDYRQGMATYYLPDGHCAEFPIQPADSMVAADFDTVGVQAAVRSAQTKAPGYSYKGFSAAVKSCGCAGYIVSFSGRRVVYYGRTAETHVEQW